MFKKELTLCKFLNQINFYVLFVLVLFSINIQAQNEVSIYSEKNYGDEILSLSVPFACKNVLDDKYTQISTTTNWPLTFKHIWVKNRVVLGVRDSIKAVDAWHYAFDLEIVKFNSNTDSVTENITLDISFDPASTKQYKDKHIFEFSGFHKFGVRVKAIRDSLQGGDPVVFSEMDKNYFIESEIEVYRYFKSDYNSPVSSLSHSILNNIITFQWTLAGESNPNQYELEWTFVDTCGRSESQIEYDFKYNSSRVLLSEKKYSFSLVYDGGVLLYRVRRIRPDSIEFKHYKYSNWLPNKPDHGKLSDWGTQNKVYLDVHTGGSKNWQFSMSFAEEGLQKEVVNYFDGSLKRRQGATFLNSENTVLIDESIYDYHGREAITVLPAPGDSSYLAYHPRFNVNNSGNPYGPSDFDSLVTVGDICSRIAPPMGTQSGASRYYSPNNPDTTGKNRFIPNANGYPFAHTEYLQDGTGRIRRQGGVGISHQLNSNHETKYYYGKPDQELLDRLFGSEAGFNKHYKKNVVQDPNGQMSISVIDQHGRVVATSLAGGVPGVVDTVNSFENVRYKYVNIVDESIVLGNKSLRISYPFTVTSAGVHKFYYSVESPGFVFGCVDLETCFDCIYDLSYTIVDECNTPVLSFTKTIGSLNSSCLFDFNLGEEELNVSDSYLDSFEIQNDSILISLNLGSYKVQKTLTVNTDSIQRVFDAWLEKDTCIKTREDFYDELYSQIDFSDCCDTCEQSMNICDAFRMGMEQDLSPGGQYFSFETNEYVEIIDKTSILYSGPGQSNPLYTLLPANTYKKPNGENELVLVNGVNYIPQDLEELEFVQYWKPSWNDALILLHPEYCSYKFCLDSMAMVFSYEEAMMETNTYDSAIARGFINPLNNRHNYPNSNLDPLYTNSANVALKNEMEANMWKFPDNQTTFPIVNNSSADLDIWALSAAITYCTPLIDDIIQYRACMIACKDTTLTNHLFTNETQRNLYWITFRNLYLTQRQKHIDQKFLSERDIFENGTYKNCIDGIGTTGDYVDKIPRFPSFSFLDHKYPFLSTSNTQEQMEEHITDSMEKYLSCEKYIPIWESKLADCSGISTEIMELILEDMLRICNGASMGDLGNPNPLGGTVAKGSFVAENGPNTFEEVLELHLGVNYKTAYCNLDLLELPLGSDHNYVRDVSFGKVSDCQCRQLEEEKNNFLACEDGWNSYLADSLLAFFKEAHLNAVLKPVSGITNLSTWGNVKWLFETQMGFGLSNLKYDTYKGYLPDSQLSIHVFDGIQNPISNNNDKCNFRLFFYGKSFSLNFITNVLEVVPSLGSFDFDLLVNVDGGSSVHRVGVKSTCFKPLQACDVDFNSYSQAFLNYFNNKYHSSLREEDLKQYFELCGSVSGPGVSCGGSPSQGDLDMVSTINQMLQNPHPSGHPKLPANITGGDSTWGCSPAGPHDMLVPNSSYQNSLFDEFHKYHNYWWEGVLTDDQNNILNNYYKDPWFIGAGLIGLVCDEGKIVQCRITYGDPFGDLYSSGYDLGDISELTGPVFDDKLGEFIVNGKIKFFDSITMQYDSIYVRLSYNSCKTGCKPSPSEWIFSQTLQNSNTTINGSYNSKNIHAIYSMLNTLAADNILTTTTKQTIPNGNLGAKSPFNPFRISSFYNYQSPHDEVEDGYFYDFLYEPIAAASGGLEYKIQNNYGKGTNDSILSATIGNLTDATGSKCQWNLRKTGVGNSSLSFSNIDFFFDLKSDDYTIEKFVKLGNVAEAGYYFMIKGGKIVMGDTVWVELRAWNTCLPLFDLEAKQLSTNLVKELPTGFGDGCECLTCPQVQVEVQELMNEYPDLHYNHPNYAAILTNGLNKKLNTNLTFSEYQAFIENCEMNSKLNLRSSICDYRISVSASSSCLTHLDSQLLHLYNYTNSAFMFQRIKTSADSVVYCINLELFDIKGRNWIIDTLQTIATQASTCNGIKKAADFIGNHSNLLFSGTGIPSCNGRTFSQLVANQNFADSISYSTFSGSKWRNHLQNQDQDAYLISWNFTNLGHKNRSIFTDSLIVWSRSCSTLLETQIPYKTTPNLESISNTCIKDTVDTTCIGCDKIKNTLIKYQYKLGTPSYENPMRHWTASNIKKELKDSLGKTFKVYFENNECVDCPDKTISVCEELSLGGNALAILFNKYIQLGQLFQTNEILADTPLLAQMFPNILFRNPKLLFDTEIQTITNGGSTDTLWPKEWKFRLQLNSKQTIRISINTNGLKFGKIDRILSVKPGTGEGAIYDFELFFLTHNGTIELAAGTSNGIVMSNCCQFRNMVLCPKTFGRVGEYMVDAPCKGDEIENAWQQSGMLYEKYISNLRLEFTNNYIEHCLNNASERAGIRLREHQYHYTLYHYDLAGNLIKTVPPAGVNYLELDDTETSQLENNRKNYNPSLHIYSEHTLSSRYRYNSLNQPVWQQTPDGGVSKFWYDKLGRLVASQNAKQQAVGNQYSYTLYDSLGRIREVGEIVSSAINEASLYASNGYTSYFLPWVAAGTKTQITRTWYDAPCSEEIDQVFGTLGQENLRNRVSTTAYYEFDGNNYTRATHYSYDIHGNVKTLIQDLPELQDLGHRFKSIEYDYDLVSGNVKMVKYQSLQADALYHKYEYDSDNRLVSAQTSNDMQIWDRDASYEYYLHGPLARATIGEKQVQGIDYAYTLHGWLKGVNSISLDATRDMGKDAHGQSTNALVAQDAFGFVLNYYYQANGHADYQAIAPGANWHGGRLETQLSAGVSQLYNGNINSMITTIEPLIQSGPLATVYRYDQLNRIAGMQTYTSFSKSSNQWNSGSLSNLYATSYRYDANGNILHLTRNTGDINNLLMDTLSYHYMAGSNQLEYVDDEVSAGAHPNDVDDQAAGNYSYDAIGNLVQDQAENIANIEWNVYGKVRRISRSNSQAGADLEFRYDAAGQRVVKVVKTGSNELNWNYQYYLRDAQGNVMATYHKTNAVSGDTSVYRIANQWLYSNQGAGAFGDFAQGQLHQGSQFGGAMLQAIQDWQEYDATMGGYSLGTMLGWDPNLIYTILQNMEGNSNTTQQEDMFQTIWNQSHSAFIQQLVAGCGGNWLVNILDADATNEELLNQLYLQNNTAFANLYADLYNMYGTPPTPAFNLSNAISFIRNNVANNEQVINMLGGYFSPSEIEAAAMQLSQGLVQSALPFGSFVQLLNCMPASDLCTAIANNYPDLAHLRDLLMQYADPGYMLGLALQNDPNFIKTTSQNQSYLVAEALRMLEDMSVESYLRKVEQGYGGSVLSQLLEALSEELTFTKKFVLADHHLYGSSRLGVKEPRRVLLQKEYTVAGFEENGEIIIDEVIDSFVYVPNNSYFYRMLAQKQYELSNHLGNVLATVLDRRIAVFDQSSGNLTHYQADIITATQFYPFGSILSSVSKGEYRYGFSGHEKIEEVLGTGNTVDMGDRWLDTRLGRTPKVDAKAGKYSSLSPYSYAANNPIIYIDPDGKEIDLSNLTAEQLTKYNAAIEILSSSKLFSYYYQQLVESRTVYTIKGSNEVNGKQVGGYFNPNNNEVGVGESFSGYVMAQELFHAFQKDGGFYEGSSPKPLSTIETEGDIMAVYVMLESRSVFPTYGEWMGDILNQAFESIPSSVQVGGEEYQKMFQKAVDDRIQYYKEQGMDAPTYTAPNTGEKPKAIEATIKGAEQSSNSNDTEKK